MCIRDVRAECILKVVVKRLTAISHKNDKVEDNQKLNP